MHTCAHVFPTFFLSLLHAKISQIHLGCLYYTSEGKHQLADISHGWNIFALTLLRDANSPVFSEGPLAYIPRTSAVREASAAELMATDGLWSISILRIAEWGWVYSGMFFSSHPDTQARSLKLTQENFIFPVYLPILMLCELSKWPQTSPCSSQTSFY